MTNEQMITMQVVVSWWVRPYLSGVAMMARLTGYRPNFEKMSTFIAKRGVRVKAARK